MIFFMVQPTGAHASPVILCWDCLSKRNVANNPNVPIYWEELEKENVSWHEECQDCKETVPKHYQAKG